MGIATTLTRKEYNIEVYALLPGSDAERVSGVVRAGSYRLVAAFGWPADSRKGVVKIVS